MAAEAQAEGPALPAAPPPPLAHGSSSPSPEKRGLPIPGNDGGAEEEERRLPEPKRRRACVAALDSVPSSVAEEAEDSPGSGCGGDEGGDGDGASFSFQYARGGFVALETTPKFGSFNPGATTVAAAAELVAFHLMKASRCRVDSSATEEAGDHRTVAGGGEEAAAEGSDENSR